MHFVKHLGLFTYCETWSPILATLHWFVREGECRAFSADNVSSLLIFAPQVAMLTYIIFKSNKYHKLNRKQSLLPAVFSKQNKTKPTKKAHTKIDTKILCLKRTRGRKDKPSLLANFRLFALFKKQMNRIQTHKRFKRTLFIRTKHNMQIFGYKTTLKRQLNGKNDDKWDGELSHLSVFRKAMSFSCPAPG